MAVRNRLPKGQLKPRSVRGSVIIYLAGSSSLPASPQRLTKPLMSDIPPAPRAQLSVIVNSAIRRPLQASGQASDRQLQFFDTGLAQIMMASAPWRDGLLKAYQYVAYASARSLALTLCFAHAHRASVDGACEPGCCATPHHDASRVHLMSHSPHPLIGQ